jgi:hypothetical protein
VFYVHRQNQAAAAAAAAAPPPPTGGAALPTDKQACMAVAAANLAAGGACAGLAIGKRLYDKFRPRCTDNAPADRAARQQKNDALNGPCAFAAKGTELWCAESSMSKLRKVDALARGTRHVSAADALLQTGQSGGLASILKGKPVPPGSHCVIYASGCAPLPQFPGAWGKCKPGTRALRGGDAGHPVNLGFYRVGELATVFEVWAGKAAAAILTGKPPPRDIGGRR